MKHNRQNLNDFKRIAYGFSEWEWCMVIDALETYIIDPNVIGDTSAIEAYVDHIKESIGLQ